MPDFRLQGLTALLTRLGTRLRLLRLKVPAAWLTENATLELFGQHCKLLEKLHLSGDYSFDALDEAHSAAAGGLHDVALATDSPQDHANCSSRAWNRCLSMAASDPRQLTIFTISRYQLLRCSRK
jgi:hypothetical protein